MVSIRTLSTATIGAAFVVLGTIGSAQAAKISIFGTSASPFTPGTANQGAWSATVPNQDTDDSYFVGRTVRGGLYRNFFTFNLSSLRGKNIAILSATLKLSRYRGAGRPTQTLRLFDVSTPPRTLNRNVGTSVPIYNDLGSGQSYGSFTRSTTATTPSVLSFLLNNNAEEDIELAGESGRFFSIGGTLNLAGRSGQQYLFQNSSDAGTQQLVVKYEVVPEPSSVMGVIGFGAFGIGWMLKRRQKDQTKASSA